MTMCKCGKTSLLLALQYTRSRQLCNTHPVPAAPYAFSAKLALQAAPESSRCGFADLTFVVVVIAQANTFLSVSVISDTVYIVRALRHSQILLGDV